MERHLKCLVIVLVVHVVDDMQSIGIGAGQPTHHLLKLLHHHIVVQHIVGDGCISGSYLVTAALIATTVDGIEQALGQVGTSAEELHLLTYLHRRYAASDAVVVTVIHTHEVVILVLDGR